MVAAESSAVLRAVKASCAEGGMGKVLWIQWICKPLCFYEGTTRGFFDRGQEMKSDLCCGKIKSGFAPPLHHPVTPKHRDQIKHCTKPPISSNCNSYATYRRHTAVQSNWQTPWKPVPLVCGRIWDPRSPFWGITKEQKGIPRSPEQSPGTKRPAPTPVPLNPEPILLWP